ncbi:MULTISPECIES: hypothetical protein [Bacillus amyloliquefaciens group]|uniref:hypothetical protein n=1 Tax=Bacillus TaxID=1386 RepID=UPI0018846CD9|nr:MULTISPECIES: hypothetical protein [Bacillus amyloliquefaciens group]MCT6831631.1 hypothetical protein [Bacillus velezensis]MCT6862784.1 hypothetical protein [Bacillus velezensis]MED2910718.1 hypothetical protein [Bacillus velezensis]QOX73627.1 hypothetical protein HWH77_00335 [Bacillus velezensis]QVV95754.1 hypothetical protein KHS93_09455 [Bacillus amyloliquefaciens]
MKTMQRACEELGENLRKFGTCLPKPKSIVNKECCLKPSEKSQKLSKRDLEDLMGVNRPTYKRGRGGAFRQK